MTSTLIKTKSRIRTIDQHWLVVNDKKKFQSGICHGILRYKANGYYIKRYDNNKESSFLTYCNRNSLY